MICCILNWQRNLIVRGQAVVSLLAKSEFRDEWDALWDRCPWGTAHQSSAYANAWYAIHGDRHEPLLLLSRAGDGTLQGLMPLTVAFPGQVTGVGLIGAVEMENSTMFKAREIDHYPAGKA